MTADFEVRGADDFLRLSKACKGAGRTELRKELHKGVRDATKPLLPKAARALAAGLPPRVASRGVKVKQVVQVRTGSDPGVTIGVRYGARGTGLGASNARLANRQGVIRHPLFGDREKWFNTPVPGALGWFDDTYSAGAPVARAAIEHSMERVVQKIIEEARRG